MSNSDIADVLKCLYNNLVNEIDNHCAGRLDENTEILAESVKNAVKTTYNNFCEPSNKIL